MDWFWIVWLISTLILPAALLFRWWRSRAIARDAFEALEQKAAFHEHRARDRLARTASYERMPTLGKEVAYTGPKPSQRPSRATPLPQWTSSPQKDDPAPLFDGLVATATEAAPVVMENVTVIESSVLDVAPSNDNGPLGPVTRKGVPCRRCHVFNGKDAACLCRTYGPYDYDGAPEDRNSCSWCAPCRTEETR